MERKCRNRIYSYVRVKKIIKSTYSDAPNMLFNAPIHKLTMEKYILKRNT